MKMMLVVSFSLIVFNIFGQSQNRGWFAHWGYNRSAYTTSDITFKGEDFNFTIHDAVAHDRQSEFEPRIYFTASRFTIPQYNYRIGRFLNDNMSLSLGMDHMKYVFDNGQTAKVTGTSHGNIYSGEEVVVGESWLKFEHSDGLNYASVEFDLHKDLVHFGKGNFTLSAISGIGLGAYIPKTLVTLYGNAVDNAFHLAGFGPDLHGKFRLSFKSRVYLELAGKAGWAFLPDVLCNSTDSKINHNFGWVQTYGVLGYQWSFKRNQSGSGDKLKDR